MSKPIKFLLEISGYQAVRVEDEGITRPVTAREMAGALREELQAKFDSHPKVRGKFRVTITEVS